jgi:hypothetical protein
MPTWVRILFVLVAAIVLLLALGWLGLQVKASSFPTITSVPFTATVPLPADLPAPVLRHARLVLGETMPQAQSAMVIGRATNTINGITMPARFRFYYDAARSSEYHDIQVTWFTLPVLRVTERFLDGQSIIDIPIIGRVENDPYTNAAANQGYWSEVLAWAPALLFADPRVRWEAIDATSARMFPPNAAAEEAFTVTFDADSGLMSRLQTLRYGDSEPRAYQRWTTRVLEWSQVNGLYVATRSDVQWNDDTPWATWEVEQVVYNVDVTVRLAQFGGDVP